MNKREAIATHLGWNYDEIEWYQPNIWSHQIVIADNDWFCATKSKIPPIVQSRNNQTIHQWEIAESIGEWNIWKHIQYKHSC